MSGSVFITGVQHREESNGREPEQRQPFGRRLMYFDPKTVSRVRERVGALAMFIALLWFIGDWYKLHGEELNAWDAFKHSLLLHIGFVGAAITALVAFGGGRFEFWWFLMPVAPLIAVVWALLLGTPDGFPDETTRGSAPIVVLCLSIAMARAVSTWRSTERRSSQSGGHTSTSLP